MSEHSQITVKNETHVRCALTKELSIFISIFAFIFVENWAMSFGVARRARSVGLSSGVFTGLLSCQILQRLASRVLAEEKVDPPEHPWSRSGWLAAYDHARYTPHPT